MGKKTATPNVRILHTDTGEKYINIKDFSAYVKVHRAEIIQILQEAEERESKE